MIRDTFSEKTYLGQGMSTQMTWWLSVTGRIPAYLLIIYNWISIQLPIMLNHSTFLLTFNSPPSLIYYTTQMSALFPMTNESLFSAYLSFFPGVCPCWRHNLLFPVLQRWRGWLEVTGKEMDLGAEGKKGGYLINRSRTDVLRWSEMAIEKTLEQTDRTVKCV